MSLQTLEVPAVVVENTDLDRALGGCAVSGVTWDHIRLDNALRDNYVDVLRTVLLALANNEAELCLLPHLSVEQLADQEKDYSFNLSQAILFASRSGDLRRDMLFIEPYLKSFMEHWQTAPTISVLVPEVVDNLNDRALAAEYLRRMLGTSHFADIRWYPVCEREWNWLKEQSENFSDHPVSFHIELLRSQL